MTHILVDFANLAFRVRHVVRGDADTKGGMAMHVCFNAIAKVFEKFEGTHVVIALEGGNIWRTKDLNAYKAHRVVERNMRSAREKEDDEIFFDYINALTEYLDEKTNVSVIKVPECEADDVIARWVQLHPDVDHVILSNDSDFYQLLAPNVRMYKGQTNETVSLRNIIDDNGMQIVDKKTKKPKEGPDPEWELFKKIMRGDPGDGIGRACIKGMRETKLREAYENRTIKGFAWNNVMLQEWEDPDTGTRRVIDRYKENEKLIDLTKQPDEYRTAIGETIVEYAKRDPIPASKIGFGFLKFCNEFDLRKLGEYPEKHTKYLKAGYDDN